LSFLFEGKWFGAMRPYAPTSNGFLKPDSSSR
jgi:hypothetical protein